jgi:SH3-like domain-containing protein
MRVRSRALEAALLVAALCSAPVYALEFRSVADPAAVLYDGPSAKASRLYVVSRGYPLEVIVAVQGWVKVRDATGAFAWIESKQLTDKRTVMVKVPLAQIRERPEDAAPLAFQAQQDVVLDLVEVNGAWAQVRHRDGASGYVKAQQLWGV